MNLTPPKLKPLHITIIAAVLAVIIGFALANFWINPIHKENVSLQDDIDQKNEQGSDVNKRQATKDLHDAKYFAQQQTAEYAAVETRFFRIGPDKQPLDLSNPLNAVQNLGLEQANTLGPIIAHWLRSTGCKLGSAIAIPAAAVDPNAIPKTVVQIPLKSIHVTGTFQQVMALLRSAPSQPRLITIDSAALSAADAGNNGTLTPGTAPSLATVGADLDISVWIIPKQATGTSAAAFSVPNANGASGGGVVPSTPAAGSPIPGGPRPGGPMAGPPGPPTPAAG